MTASGFEGALAFALLVAGCGAVAVARHRDGEFLTPGTAVAAAWSISYGLYLVRLLPYGPMPRGAAALLALGAGSLLAGVGFGRWCCRRLHPRLCPVAHAAWLWAYGAAGLLGLVWYLWEVHRAMGLRALWLHPFQVRLALVSGRIPNQFLFLEFFAVITPLVAAAAALAGRRWGKGLWALVVICAAGTLVLVERTQFFTIVLGAGFMVAYRVGPRLDRTRLGGFLVLCAALLVVSFLAVGLWRGRGDAGLTSASHPRPTASVSSAAPSGGAGSILRGRSDLYLYATGSYAAFAVWYQTLSPRTHGLHVAHPLFRALQRVGLYAGDLPSDILPFVAVLPRDPRPVGWNGYTLLYYPLLDFGAVGMVLYCLIVGAFSGAAYQAVRVARRSPPHLLVAAHTTTALVLSIFVNKFNNTAWWYILLFSVAPFVVSRWLERVPTTGSAARLKARRA
jgi:hypothetical protein